MKHIDVSRNTARMITAASAIVAAGGLASGGSTSCPISFTQSHDPDLIQSGNVACVQPQEVTTNGWARSWSAGFIREEICEIEFGVEQTGFADEVTVNIYQGDINDPFDVLALVGSVAVALPPDVEFELLTVVFDPPIAIDNEQPVIVEVFAVNHPASKPFLAGSNWQGETGFSYMRAPECDVPDFTPMHEIGPNVQLVLNVSGHGQPGDLNGDGVVDGADLLILLAAWGPCEDCAADLNGDGVVDGMDLLILLQNWG